MRITCTLLLSYIYVLLLLVMMIEPLPYHFQTGAPYSRSIQLQAQ